MYVCDVCEYKTTCERFASATTIDELRKSTIPCNKFSDIMLSHKIDEELYELVGQLSPRLESSSTPNQELKRDAGKPQLTLVPTQIITDIARVREFGVAKYHKRDSWKDVEIQRYRDALFRHLLLYINDPKGVDEESGLPHLSHVACNVAFLCELEKTDGNGSSNK